MFRKILYEISHIRTKCGKHPEILCGRSSTPHNIVMGLPQPLWGYDKKIFHLSIYQGCLTLEPHVNFKLFKRHEGPWGRMSSLCTVLRGRTMHRTIYVWVQVPTIATYGNRWQFIWFVTIGYFDIRPTFFDEPIAIQSVDPKSQPHDATWISHLIKSILSPRPSHSSVKWSQTVPGFSANHIICNARVKGPQAQVQSDPKSTYILSCDQGR